MIVWLASYPGSGNALLCAILSQTMGLESTSDDSIEPGWDAFYETATHSSEIFLVETHRPPRDHQPAIYLVRDGRNALLSEHPLQPKFLNAPCLPLMERVLGGGGSGGWSDHYRIWAERPNTLTVRHEQLVNIEKTTLTALAGQVRFKGEIAAWVNPFENGHADHPSQARNEPITWQETPAWTELVEGVFQYLHGQLMRDLGYETENALSVATEPMAFAHGGLIQMSRQFLIEKIRLEKLVREQRDVIEAHGVAHAAHDTLINKLLSGDQIPRHDTASPLQTGGRSREPAASLRDHAWFRPGRSRLHKIFAPHRYPKIGRLSHHDPIPIQNWGMPPMPNIEAAIAWPKISIVTPSFRQAAYIGRTMQSVLGKAYPRLEYFIQDGGSVDGTVEIIQSQAARLSGWQSQTDRGQSQAINLGFSRTSGEIMAWLNSDDLLMPGTLAYVAEYFTLHPEVDVVYGHRILIDEQDREIGRWVLPRHSDSVLSWADFVPQETLFWRRSLWEKCGGQIDESFRFAMDWDLLLRFRAAGARMVRLPKFLGAFRIHEAQKTSSAIHETGYQEMHLLRKRELGREVDYRDINRALLPYALAHVIYDVFYRLRKKMERRPSAALHVKVEII